MSLHVFKQLSLISVLTSTRPFFIKHQLCNYCVRWILILRFNIFSYIILVLFSPHNGSNFLWHTFLSLPSDPCSTLIQSHTLGRRERLEGRGVIGLCQPTKWTTSCRLGEVGSSPCPQDVPSFLLWNCNSSAQELLGINLPRLSRALSFILSGVPSI